MRLLHYDDLDELCLTKDLSDDEIPKYAILSHTWGADEDEITLQQLNLKPDKSKLGYKKIQLCGEQARRDGLNYFWVDTCCIDKTSSSELSKNLNLMFRYYQNSERCYVYLSDVDDVTSKEQFTESKWFKRGWTLQELLAPKLVDFFSRGWESLGTRITLEASIHETTQIPLDALRGSVLTGFSQDERMRWTAGRSTKEKEDKAYCLLGIFGVSMAPRYGEGESAALARLNNKIKKSSKPTAQVIDDRIRDYYLSDGRLDIERLSGERLPMDRCFINLAIVNGTQDKNEDDDFDGRGPNSLSLFTRPKIDNHRQMDVAGLESLFNLRTLSHGAFGQPKRVMIWGRAGMGKTTLCKKIVYDFLHNDLWQSLYDRIFWLPLRRLKLMSHEAKTVPQMIQELSFHGGPDGMLCSEILQEMLTRPNDRCLFLLDGLDEVSHLLDDDSPMGANLYKLLKQGNLILTSRPHGAPILKRAQLDCEFETIGFSSDQVDDYLHKELDHGMTSQDTISAIKSFIRRNPVVQSLVQIPIQLDAVCFVWDQEQFQDVITMTLLYQSITNKLWQRDIVRLGKKLDGDYITSQQIRNSPNTRHLVEPEISCLEELAFAGLYCQLVEFGSEHVNAVAGGHIPLLDSRLSKVSFLRSSDKSSNIVNQTHHFIHLTFQEYFAAQYFVRHWSSGQVIKFPKLALRMMRHSSNMVQLTPLSFIQMEKYSTRFEIFWRFVTGLVQIELGDQGLDEFFSALEMVPHDQLGVYHQFLIARCLNETVGHQCHFGMAQKLESKLGDWAVYDANHGRTSVRYHWLLKESPDSVLRRCLRGSTAEKAGVMEALLRKSSLSAEFMDAAIRELRHIATADSSVYDSDRSRHNDLGRNAWAVIAKNCDQLSETVFSDLFTTHKEYFYALGCVTFGMGNLMRQKLIQLLDDSQWSHLALKALEFYDDLSEQAINTLCLLLEQQRNEVDNSVFVLQLLRRQRLLIHAFVERLLRYALREDLSSGTLHYLIATGTGLAGFEVKQSTIDNIFQLIRDRDALSQCKTVLIFAWRNNVPAFIINNLIALLRDPGSVIGGLEHAIREQASLALIIQRALPEPAIRQIFSLLQHPDPELRCKAVRSLWGKGNLPEFAVQSLIRLLHDCNDTVRTQATQTLSSQANFSKAVIETLVELLSSDNVKFITSAAKALRKQRTLPEFAMNALVDALHHDSCDVRVSAMKTLRHQNDPPQNAVHRLTQILCCESPNVDEQRYARFVLEKISTIPKSCLEPIIKHLKFESSSSRAAAILEKQAEFYNSLTNLDLDSMKNLMNYWYTMSLDYQRHYLVLFHDDSFVVQIDARCWTTKFKDGERDAFERKWRDAQQQIGVPIVRSTNQQSKVAVRRVMTQAEEGRTKRVRHS